MSATRLIDQRGTQSAVAMRHLFEELNREDSELRPHLLDAALAGLRLSRNPKSDALRCDAAEVWSIIEPLISHHLQAEDDEMLLWADRHAHISPDVLHRIRQCHCKLRKLVTAIETARFESVTDAEATAAGRALCALAVCLDDAIDAEERKIFPAIQKAIFKMDRGALRVRREPSIIGGPLPLVAQQAVCSRLRRGRGFRPPIGADAGSSVRHPSSVSRRRDCGADHSHSNAKRRNKGKCSSAD